MPGLACALHSSSQRSSAKEQKTPKIMKNVVFFVTEHCFFLQRQCFNCSK